MREVTSRKQIHLRLYYKCLSAYNQMIAFLIKPPVIKQMDETLEILINDKPSVSRFGDGEFSLMYKRGLKFQPYSETLSKRLRDIIKSNQHRHLVCIPNVFQSLDHFEEKPRRFWASFLNLKRSEIYSLINMKKVYFDAMITRLYMDRKDKVTAGLRFNKFKQIWNNRDIVIVEGEKSRLGVGNDLFNNSKSIIRIICPAVDAFSKYDMILNSVREQEKSNLILIALGPTATVLAYDLALDGYQAIDIGHIDIEYEWFLQKATAKCLVQNKYVAEVKGGTNVHDLSDDKYISEIIKKIS